MARSRAHVRASYGIWGCLDLASLPQDLCAGRDVESGSRSHKTELWRYENVSRTKRETAMETATVINFVEVLSEAYAERIGIQ